MTKSTMVALVAGIAISHTAAEGFTVSSPDFSNGGTLRNTQVLNGFGCSGGNLSPELSWKNAPAGTKSLAVTVYDPDAPTGSGWWHWLIFNIPAGVTHLSKGAGDPAKGLAPAGSVQSRTDFGSAGYGGACPPQGDKPHRYVFTVYALKTDKLDLPPTSSGAMVGYYLNAQALARATVTAMYGR